MRKYLIVAALMLAAGAPAFAEEPSAASAAPAAHTGPKMGQRTLAEEKALLRKRLDRLEKMTEEQWQARKKARAERREKWRQMSPEQKAEMKEKMKARRTDGKNAPPAAVQ